MKIIDLTQGSDAWLEYRKTKIMASDAPVICGVSPYEKTPYKLWLEKLGLYKQEVTAAMTRGSELEPMIRDMFHKELILSSQFEPCVVEHENIEWMAASLDGLSIDRTYLLEIKCTNKETFLMVKGGEVPLHWMYQIQHQLMCTSGQGCYLYSYHDGNTHLKLIRPDPDMQSKILAKEMEFWELLQNFTPPPLTDKDFVNKKDPVWLAYATLYREKEELIQALEEEKTLIKQKLIELSEGKNSVGGGIKLLKIVRKGNIDYSSIPALQDMDLEKYRKPALEYIKISKMH